MKWILKAVLQKALSAMPNGEQLNYAFQKRTGGLPVSDSEFVEKVRLAHERVRRFESFGPHRALDEISCFEFGGGWDLIGPFTYHSFGVNIQTVIDIRPNVHLELVNDTIEKFRKNWKQCEEITGRTLRSIGEQVKSKEEIAERYGIHYLAPCDAAKTGLPAESFDFISTNSTLEHIPAESLPAILAESKRLLKSDGIMCHFIDMKDHFSYFDSSITKYNYLTIPDWRWNLINSPLANQNRLRYKDYHTIISDAGLKVFNEDVDFATPKDLDDFRRLQLTSRFAGTDSVENLSAHILRVVLGK